MADILSISSGAVGVYQRVLGVVSNNIANVGNEGYVKQDASVSQTPPTFDGRNFLGTGAMFQGVQRQYNAFIENSLRNATSSLAGQKAMVSYADRIIDVLGSGEIGLSPALDRFFSAARALSSDPASPVARTGLLRETEGVASRFVELSSQMQQVDAETQQSMKSDIAQVNALASQLARINQELSRNRSLDRQAPAMLDERDSVLRQIADRLDIQVIEADNGVVTVSVGGAGSSGALVAGNVAKPLEVRFDPNAPERVDVLLDPWGREPVSIAGITGGSFGGLSVLRAQLLEPALSNLDLLAKEFMTEVNRIHTQGVDGYGNLGGDLLGIETSFAYERIRGQNPLNIEAHVSNLAAFDGKPVTMVFDAQAGQVYSTSLLGPFAQGDRFQVTLNGLSKTFALGQDASLSGVADQLRQFIDGAFGVQLRADVDPNGQVVINSSVMKSFALDVQVSSEQGRVQIDQTQGLWVATDRDGRRVTGVNALEINGVAIEISGAAVDGEQVIVQPSSRPAAGLRSLITDPQKVAAANAFRATRDVDNLSTVKAVVADGIGQSGEVPAAPVLGSAKGLANNPVVSEALEWVAQRVVPVATVAAGQRDVVIYLDPMASNANLQIVTRDGRHILGTELGDGESFVGNITSLPAPFVPGSTYSDTYLNKLGTQAYRDLSMFYGARALPARVEVLGVDHVPTAVELRPARLAAELEPDVDGLEIPDGALLLNGVALPGSASPINSIEALASYLNGAIASASAGSDAATQAKLAGIAVEVDNGVLQFTRSATAGPADAKGRIELSFGPEGDSQLLARMGFRTAAYLDGEMPEDLLVFTTGSGDVKVAASFTGQPLTDGQRRSVLRASPLEVIFESAGTYRIEDINTGTVLAKRAYTTGSSIDYQGLRISLSADPSAGDRFTLDGNHDGTGDNGNASRMAILEKQAATGPGGSLTFGEAYLDVVDRLSNLTQQTQVSSKALEVVHQQAVEARESVSGVSLDEEAANLIRFQQAYQAAAKSMQVASQMFDAVLRI